MLRDLCHAYPTKVGWCTTTPTVVLYNGTDYFLYCIDYPTTLIVVQLASVHSLLTLPHITDQLLLHNYILIMN